MNLNETDILNFWFEELKPRQWWVKDPAFDALLADRFSDLHRAACVCELSPWRSTAEGRLAEILILDQFSRNIYRNSADAFAADPLALVLAQEAVTQGGLGYLPAQQGAFLLMPFMHSESALVHERALPFFEDLGRDDTLEFELKHKAIIDRFGRYPHRNEILGRRTTDEERQFLLQPGSSF